MTDDAPTGSERTLSRRTLLQRAGIAAAAVSVGGGLAACGGDNETPGQVDQDVNAVEFPPLPPTTTSVTAFFTRDEAQTIDAIVGRLIPGDAGDPGAREAGVPRFIDTKLAQFASFATPTYFDAPFAKPVVLPPGPQDAPTKTIAVQKSELPRYGFQGSSTPQDAYRAGIASLDAFTKKEHGTRFVELDEARQDAVLSVVEAGKAGGWPDAGDFFKLVLEDTYEGMFSDPIYGGNHGFAGWKLVGYPGAQRAYTPHELKNGPQEKRIQGLRDMAAMNPGVPQDHVILPMAGTRMDPNMDMGDK
jgi:gluconate 2-dehydrogenase gamma chain